MGAWRRAGVWLGLVEDDGSGRYADNELESYDEYDEPATPPRRAERAERAEHVSERAASRGADVRAFGRASAHHGGQAPLTRDNLALAPQMAYRERAVVTEEETAYRITTLHPTTYNEARTIGEHFRDGVPVIMNLTEMDESDAKRLVDFAAGLAFGLRGSIERVTNRVFLLSPANVEVTAEDKARIAEGGFFNQS